MKFDFWTHLLIDFLILRLICSKLEHFYTDRNSRYDFSIKIFILILNLRKNTSNFIFSFVVL